MKKKFISLLLVGVMVLSNASMVFAEETTDASQENEIVTINDITDTTDVETIWKAIDEMCVSEGMSASEAWNANYPNFVSGTDAVKVATNGSDKIVILDVRAAEVRKMNGHLKGSLTQPLFTWDGTKNNVSNLEDKLASDFTTFVTGNADLENKQIYILCNGGQSGARAALKLLTKAGYAWDKLNVIQYGAGGAEVKAALTYNYNFATGAEALEAQKEGAVILDVRSTENYADYHVANSLSQPLFTDAGPISSGADDLANAFTAFVKDNNDLAGKKIYIVCNSGARGAQLATKLLMQTGQYDLANIFTITNGAKDLHIIDAAIGNSWDTEGVTVNPLRKTGAETVAAIGNSNVIILDVRAAEVREMNGHLTGSISQPVFHRVNGSNKCVDVFNTEDALVSAFNKFAADNKEAYAGKDIYILCNGGQSGARAALKLLLSKGYNFDNLYTVTSGASDADVKAALTYDYNFATGAEALADENGIIIDVRNEKNHNNYNLADSTWVPLFDADNKISTDSELATAFTAFAKSEEGQSMIGKNIYILCNSGKRGAETATKLLMQTGLYDLDNIFTITNGSKDLDILDAAIGNGGDSWNNDYPNFVSGKDAVKAVGNKDIVILDVRATAVRNANGELKGSVAQPLFNHVNGKNVVTTLKDDLAANFTAFVKGNKDLAGKEIYVLCNGGQSGARAALKLLINAGYSYDNIKVIKGGAGDADVKAALVPVNVTGTVQTGDAAPIIPYILVMGAALAAVVVTSKKKFVK